METRWKYLGTRRTGHRNNKCKSMARLVIDAEPRASANADEVQTAAHTQRHPPLMGSSHPMLPLVAAPLSWRPWCRALLTGSSSYFEKRDPLSRTRNFLSSLLSTTQTDFLRRHGASSPSSRTTLTSWCINFRRRTRRAACLSWNTSRERAGRPGIVCFLFPSHDPTPYRRADVSNRTYEFDPRRCRLCMGIGWHKPEICRL